MSQRSTQKSTKKSTRRKSEPSTPASTSSISGASKSPLTPETGIATRSKSSSKSPTKPSTRRSHSKSQSPRKASPVKVRRRSSSGAKSPPVPKSPMQVSPSTSKLPRSPDAQKVETQTKRGRSQSPPSSEVTPTFDLTWVSPKKPSPTKQIPGSEKKSLFSVVASSLEEEDAKVTDSPEMESPSKRARSRLRTPSETPDSPARWISPETDRPHSQRPFRKFKFTSLRSKSSGTEAGPSESPSGERSSAEGSAELEPSTSRKSPLKRRFSKSLKRPDTLPLPASASDPGCSQTGRRTPYPDLRKLRVMGWPIMDAAPITPLSPTGGKKSFVFLPKSTGLDRDRMCNLMSQLYGFIQLHEDSSEGNESSEGSYTLNADCADLPNPIIRDDPAELAEKLTAVANLGYRSPPSVRDEPMSVSRTPSGSRPASAASGSKDVEDSPERKPDTPTDEHPAGTSSQGTSTPSSSAPSQTGTKPKRPLLVRQKAEKLDPQMPITMLEWCNPPESRTSSSMTVSESKVALGSSDAPAASISSDAPAASSTPEASFVPPELLITDESVTTDASAPPQEADPQATPGGWLVPCESLKSTPAGTSESPDEPSSSFSPEKSTDSSPNIPPQPTRPAPILFASSSTKSAAPGATATAGAPSASFPTPALKTRSASVRSDASAASADSATSSTPPTPATPMEVTKEVAPTSAISSTPPTPATPTEVTKEVATTSDISSTPPTPATPTEVTKDAVPRSIKRRHSKAEKAELQEPSLKPARKKSHDGSSRAAAAAAEPIAPPKLETQDMGPPPSTADVEQRPGTSGYREIWRSIDSEESLSVATGSRVGSTDSPMPTTPFDSGLPSMVVSPLDNSSRWRKCYRDFLRRFNKTSTSIQDFFDRLETSLKQEIRRPGQSPHRRYFLIAGLTIWLLIRDTSNDYWFLCSTFGKQKAPESMPVLNPDRAIELQGLDLEDDQEEPSTSKKRGKATRKALGKLLMRRRLKREVSLSMDELLMRIKVLDERIRATTPVGRLSPRRDFTGSFPFVTVSFSGDEPRASTSRDTGSEAIDDSKLRPSWVPKEAKKEDKRESTTEQEAPYLTPAPRPFPRATFSDDPSETSG